MVHGTAFTAAPTTPSEAGEKKWGVKRRDDGGACARRQSVIDARN
jgi:hypothetical protein